MQRLAGSVFQGSQGNQGGGRAPGDWGLVRHGRCGGREVVEGLDAARILRKHVVLGHCGPCLVMREGVWVEGCGVWVCEDS